MAAIEKNVPIPHLPFRTGARYPYLDLEIGDSFVVTDRKASQVSNSLYQFARVHPGWRGTVRTMPDGTVRVWRIA